VVLNRTRECAQNRQRIGELPNVTSGLTPLRAAELSSSRGPLSTQHGNYQFRRFDTH
jgi:hypothetical protein